MAQSLSKIYLHLIFSTKNRYPLILPEFKEELFKYIGGILNGQKCPNIIVGGHNDHIHTLFILNRNLNISDLVREIKSQSSKWVTELTKRYFFWQNGYGVFSVSQSKVEEVQKYILNQEEHHKKVTFKEEYINFLKAYQIEYDEKYLWED